MTKTKTINSAARRLTVISALLLFLVFAANGSVQAQLQTVPIAPRIALTAQRTTGQAPLGMRTMSARPRVMNAKLVAPAIVGARRGPLVLDLVPNNARVYDNGSVYDNNVARTIDSFSVPRAPLSVATPAAPLEATPPGTFGLPAIPGAPQTPTTEALRAGNINLGAMAAWLARHAHAPRIGEPNRRP